MECPAIHIWKPEIVLHEGAEAIVTAGSWLGRRAVLSTADLEDIDIPI
ncbi:MAG: hypothetical protein Ct9H90mP24_4940 [Methanobacteriota archaeon]|nr:MAG: hypothetical protein Ct9H90mP24_4940 [Euryarchaeota archaeon]